MVSIFQIRQSIATSPVHMVVSEENRTLQVKRLRPEIPVPGPEIEIGIRTTKCGGVTRTHTAAFNVDQKALIAQYPDLPRETIKGWLTTKPEWVTCPGCLDGSL